MLLYENYKWMIEELEKEGHFDELGQCQHCSVTIQGDLIAETYSAMVEHLEKEHDIKIEF